MTDNESTHDNTNNCANSIPSLPTYNLSHDLVRKLFLSISNSNPSTFDTNIATKLLEETSGECISDFDSDGNTPLMRSMQINGDYPLVLIGFSQHNITKKNNKGHNALYYALKHEREMVVYSLLNYDQEINWHNMCKKSWNRCFIKGLQNKFSLNTLSWIRYEKTVLMRACDEKLEEIALNILDYPTLCNLDYVNQYKGTALMVACDNNLESVAVKMLTTPSLCNLTYSSYAGDALIIAAKNKLTKVVCAISLAMNSALEIDLQTTMDKYRGISDFNKKYEQELEKHNSIGTCLCCSTENDSYYIITPCSHTVNVCPDCYPRLTQKNVCAVCKGNIDSYKRTYLVI